MGNCLMLLGIRRIKRPVKLLIVGLDNAGKTTAAKGIVGDSVENVAPTIGFCPENLEYRGCEITMYDLGGRQGIRKVWSNYFSEVHGLIFVVDSSDKERIEECRKVLYGLISHRSISGKPVLVLANKQDIEGALDEIDLVEALRIEDIVNSYKCPTRLETCSASIIHKKKPDKHIADGFRWLIDTIVVHYLVLSKRVEKEQEEKSRNIYDRESLPKIVEQNKKEKIVPENVTQTKDLNELESQASIRTFSDDRVSRSSSNDAQELNELGCASSYSDHSSSSSADADSLQKTKINTSHSKNSVSPHRIQVQPPSSQKELENSKENYSQTITELKSSDSSKQELKDVHRSSDCIPFNPDYDLFTVDAPSEENIKGLHINSANGSIFSKGCAVSAVKKHIELEAASGKKQSRKLLLLRNMQNSVGVSPESRPACTVSFE